MGYIYKPRHQYQLGPGSYPTGGYDCTAYSAAMAIDRATLGGTIATGRQVRLASSEPTPDRDSPGLNLNQVINVAFKWHVDLDSRYGAPWSSLIAALKSGRGLILQGDYDQIPAGFSGQLSFKGDHAVFINHVTGDGDLYWMDPLREKGAVEIKASVARAYAEKLAKKWGIYPGLAFATTRITPTIAVAQK
jgi:hypothetical protein